MTETEPAAYRIGQAIVTRILEVTLAFPARRLLPDREPAPGRAPGAEASAEAATETLSLSVHAWLVRIGGLTVLVDAGIGNGKTRCSPLFDHLDTPWLDRLAAAGARPEDVTHVLLTHLHADHVGWNTVLRAGRWMPTFPNARIVMPRRGCAQFTAPGGRQHRNYGLFADSVLPVIEAGQADFVPDEGGTVLAGFTYLPTPGHSTDHMSILLQSDGGEALFAGDVLHHPSQVAHPDWSSMFCEDPEEARRSRLRALDFAAGRGLTWFSAHLTGTSAGRVTRTNESFAWSFL
jgi:glyoxylase-like metal-dependent hydrolase (beta-lactamase superfamily II)